METVVAVFDIKGDDIAVVAKGGFVDGYKFYVDDVEVSREAVVTAAHFMGAKLAPKRYEFTAWLDGSDIAVMYEHLSLPHSDVALGVAMAQFAAIVVADYESGPFQLTPAARADLVAKLMTCSHFRKNVIAKRRSNRRCNC